MDAGIHSDTISEDAVYIARAPAPSYPPNRPPGDMFRHLDTDTDSSEESDEEEESCGGSRRTQGSTRRYQIPERVGNFVLLAEHRINVAPYIRVAKWKSEKSGLSVVWADTPDLISSFSTTVVTEIFNDSGVPHTKEHLTFTSAKHYPFSNALDSIAGRLLTNGVNASTELDNTTYTVDSASSEGMLALIPVYLDHILFPLMDENIFKTEIYHVNEKGEEGGTVYSEMQGREGSQDDVMQLEQQRALYHIRNAYRSETGGMLAQLRSLTLEDIIEYHETAYVPQNMTVVVTGRQIDPRRLLETISQTTEHDIATAGLARGPHPQNWVRPFVESTTADYDPVIGKDKSIVVPFPSTDTSTGSIMISVVGPSCRDTLTCTALGVLGEYLSGSAHSVLNRQFVEVPEPACAEISFDLAVRDPSIFTIQLGAVKKDRLSSLADELNLVLEQLCREPIDMKEMALVIKQEIIGVERMMETSPAAYIQVSVLEDIIYGAENGDTLSSHFKDVELLKKLSRWNGHDWMELFKEYLVERHSVTLIGTPEPRLVKEQAKEDAARLANRVRQYGPAGLAKLGAELKQAENANRHPLPGSLLRSYPVPDFRKISWLSTDTARSNGVAQGRRHFYGSAQRIINSDGGDLPFFIQFDHVPSNFVVVKIVLHGPSRPILPLLVDAFFSMPVELASGHRLTWTEVSRKMDEDLTSRGAGIENEFVVVRVTALKEDYAKAVSWLSDVLYGSVFEVDRLRNLVNTTLEVLPSIKADGARIAQAAVSAICYEEASFKARSNAINQIELYPRLKERLELDPQGVVRDLEVLRSDLLDPRAMRISVVGDVASLENPSSTWLDCFERVAPFPASQMLPIFRPRHLLTPVGEHPAKVAIVYRIDDSQSTYLTALSRCPDWNHPDYAALRVASTLLSQTNGLLWNVTRSAGLCYGATIFASVEAGTLGLGIYRSPDALVALAAIRSLLKEVASGKVAISQTSLEAAKSELAYATVQDQSTPAKAASGSFLNTVILNKPRDHAKRFLESVELVTVDLVHRVIDTWVIALTDPKRSVVGAASSVAKFPALVGGLTKLGYGVEQRHF